jgi:uncharacterized protein
VRRLENSITDPHANAPAVAEGIERAVTRKRRVIIPSAAVFLVLVLYTLVVLISLIYGLDVPPLRARVSDLAGIIPADRARALEQRLADFERETGHQLAVLTIPTLAGDSLEDFSIRVAENWKVGQKGFDNGAILVVVRDDRKLRIEVGYGLEGVLPDAIASRIIREVIAPRFRAGDFAGGIEAGTDAIMKITRGEKISDAVGKPARQNQNFEGIVGALLIAGLFALVIGISQRTVPRGAFGGAAAAGVSTAFASGGAGPGLWILAIVLGAILGGLSNIYARQNSNRAWTGRSPRRYNHWGTAGWGPSYGGGFGGGFSGGGFSGGGGSFGGGGASGSW